MIELSEWINAKTVEDAYIAAKQAQMSRNQNFANTGMRAAHARDPKLLLALEKAAEVLEKMQEDQHGRTKRSSRIFAETTDLTEVSLWKGAYKSCDIGIPHQAYEWIYGAAAKLAGLGNF
jgi:hypothetical protein